MQRSELFGVLRCVCVLVRGVAFFSSSFVRTSILRSHLLNLYAFWGITLVCAASLAFAQVVETGRGQALADEYGMKFFEASAKSNTNVTEAFMSLARDAARRHLRPWDVAFSGCCPKKLQQASQ